MSAAGSLHPRAGRGPRPSSEPQRQQRRQCVRPAAAAELRGRRLRGAAQGGGEGAHGHLQAAGLHGGRLQAVHLRGPHAAARAAVRAPAAAPGRAGAGTGEPLLLLRRLGLSGLRLLQEAVELQLGVDESYSLSIPDDDSYAGNLTAATVWGALRGLETFTQLVSYQNNFPGQEPGYYLYWTPLYIEDSPRFPWRGLLVDSSRHYLSVPLLERTIDTMAAMKLNTLHWHIVDAESFPFVSEKYTELQEKSTYHPLASYDKETIAHLVNFARDRGIRIVPEFDTPGHTASIGQAYPELIADCYDWLVEHYHSDLRWSMWDNVALDVTKDSTKEFVQNVITEMAALFPDNYFHVSIL